jgi:hypothetical protein
MIAWKVDARVGNVNNDDARLLEAVHAKGSPEALKRAGAV